VFSSCLLDLVVAFELHSLLISFIPLNKTQDYLNFVTLSAQILCIVENETYGVLSTNAEI